VSDRVAAKVVATFDAVGVEILNGNAPGARMKPKQPGRLPRLL
jgi:hypothetical protein